MNWKLSLNEFKGMVAYRQSRIHWFFSYHVCRDSHKIEWNQQQSKIKGRLLWTIPFLPVIMLKKVVTCYWYSIYLAAWLSSITILHWILSHPCSILQILYFKISKCDTTCCARIIFRLRHAILLQSSFMSGLKFKKVLLARFHGYSIIYMND